MNYVMGNNIGDIMHKVSIACIASITMFMVNKAYIATHSYIVMQLL